MTINSQYITSALSKISDKNAGIRISDVAKAASLISSKNNNREISKILLGLGWTKSEKHYRTMQDRFYLWFPPVKAEPTTVKIDSEELKQLRDNDWRQKNKIIDLEEKLANASEQIVSLNKALDQYIMGIKEEVEKPHYSFTPEAPKKDEKPKEVSKVNNTLPFNPESLNSILVKFGSNIRANMKYLLSHSIIINEDCIKIDYRRIAVDSQGLHSREELLRSLTCLIDKEMIRSNGNTYEYKPIWILKDAVNECLFETVG